MNGTLIEHYTNRLGEEILVFEYDPKVCLVIPKMVGQSKTLAGGNVRCFYTRSQYDDCVKLCEMALEPELEMA